MRTRTKKNKTKLLLKVGVETSLKRTQQEKKSKKYKTTKTTETQTILLTHLPP